MPTIITATQLRNLIGVSSSLYNDAYLNQIIDTAESVVLPLLTTYKSFIQKTELTSNVATFHTVGEHEFSEGQSIAIAGCGSPYNGTRTVLADNLTSTTFSASITNADIIFTCVGNDDDLSQVVLAKDGIIHHAKDGSILVDHSTVSAEVSRDLANLLAQRSIDFVDAPVSGGQLGAQKGQLSIFLGICLLVAITLLAFIVNVGLFVKAKINLQNLILIDPVIHKMLR